MNPQLHDNEWEISLTRNPDTFIEALCLNILYSEDTSKATVARQRVVFNKWLRNYESSLRHELRQALEAEQELVMALAERKAEYRGQISALSNLPMRKSVVGEIVNLKEVVGIIKQLKAEV